MINPGALPRSSLAFCDIEDDDKPPHCLRPDEVGLGVSLSHAAVDLASGQSSNVALDFSPNAMAAHGCAPGQPVVITYRGPFPTGTALCMNCGDVIGVHYTDVSAACAAKCQDLNGGGSEAFCAAAEHAHASTNASFCLAGACTSNGSPLTGEDPRRTAEPVNWVNLVGVGVSGPGANTLTRTAAQTPPAPGSFDAGAASSQVINHGDGYVEFTVTERDKARACGLSPGTPPDGDASDADIRFGIRLSVDSHVLISERGALVAPPDGNPGFWFADYATGDRLRVTVTDNFDGTANVAYFLIPGVCAGANCPIKLRPTGSDPPLTASYPFRVDASLRDAGATLTDVRIVRIK